MEDSNQAKKRQRLMQAGEPGTKSKLSLSVANDCDRPGDLQLLLQRKFAHVWRPSQL